MPEFDGICQSVDGHQEVLDNQLIHVVFPSHCWEDIFLKKKCNASINLFRSTIKKAWHVRILNVLIKVLPDEVEITSIHPEYSNKDSGFSMIQDRLLFLWKIYKKTYGKKQFPFRL